MTVKVYDSSEECNSSVVLWLRRFSGEEQAHCSASEKSFNYINGGELSAFCQKQGCIYYSLKVN